MVLKTLETKKITKLNPFMRCFNLLIVFMSMVYTKTFKDTLEPQFRNYLNEKFNNGNCKLTVSS